MPPPSSSFSWREIDAESGQLAKVPHPGVYASDVFDQHQKGWCGACYLVSAVQCVDDRGYIASVRRMGRLPLLPRRRVSLQTTMDHYQLFQGSKEEEGWNGCHGGLSSEVFQCLVEKGCPLDWEAKRDGFDWSGFVRSVGKWGKRDEASGGYSVLSHSSIPPNEVSRHIVSDGPVVLEVSAEVCLSADERGVCVDLLPRSPDHAVCVVGWREVDGVGVCWVCRNSWGKEKVPDNLPHDYTTCVGVDYNQCNVPTHAWTGMPSDPGFFLLPCSYLPLMNRHSSPWIAPRVVVRE
jgi:hypothetical protein